MPAEYSYFRAEGRSLQALETRDDANSELEELTKKLAAKFGAQDCQGWIDHFGTRFRIHCFFFAPPQAPPAGWIGSDGAPLAAMPEKSGRWSALPAPGSADHFAVAAMAGLMERAARRTKLGFALGAPEMPYREVP